MRKKLSSDSERARLNLGITQGELAALLGVHPITVSKWERRKAEPSPWQCAALKMLWAVYADHLDVSTYIAQYGGFDAFKWLCLRTEY